jgi:hypothetical protein
MILWKKRLKNSEVNLTNPVKSFSQEPACASEY